MKQQSLNSWLHWGNHWVFTFFSKCSKDINRVTFDHRGVFSAFLDLKALPCFIDEQKSQTAIAKLFLRQYGAQRVITVAEQKLFKQYNALRINITALFDSDEPPLSDEKMKDLPNEIKSILVYRSENALQSTQFDEDD